MRPLLSILWYFSFLCSGLFAQTSGDWRASYENSLQATREGQLQSAFDLAKQAVDLADKEAIAREAGFELLYHLDTLALLLWDLELADSVARKLNHLTETHFPKQTQRQQARRAYAWSSFYLNRFEQAEKIARRGLRRAKRAEANQRAAFLEILGMVYLRREEMKKARRYLDRSLEIHQAVFGKTNVQTARTLFYLGQWAYTRADYNLANRYFGEASAILNTVYPTPRPEQAVVLEWRALNYFLLAEYDLAETLYQQARDIWESYTFFEHPAYARVLEGIGLLEGFFRGELETAEELFNQTADINRRYFGEESFQIAETLSNLSQLKLDLEDYDGSLADAQKAVSLVDPDVQTSIYATLLNNLGSVYAYRGEIKKAGATFEEVIRIREKKFGKQNLSLVYALNNYGIFLEEEDEVEKALENYLRCLDILEKEEQTASKVYGDLTTNLSIFYEEKAKDTQDSLQRTEYILKAGEYLEKSLISSKKVLGAYHPEHIVTLFNLATFYDRWQKDKPIDSLYLFAIDRQLDLIQNVYDGFDEQTQLRYIAEAQEKIAIFYSHAYRRQVSRPDLLRKAQEIHYAVKNLSVEYSMVNQLRGRLVEDLQLQKYYLEWKTAKEQLAKAYLQNEIQRLAAGVVIEDLENKVAQLEKEITRNETSKQAVFRPYKEYASIIQALQPEEVFVDFVQFSYFDPDTVGFTDTLYGAFLNFPQNASPVYVPLLRKNELLASMDMDTTNSPHFTDRAFPVYIENSYWGVQIYERIWRPIFKHLDGVQTIHFAPDGLLHKIALEALPADEDETKRPIDDYRLLRYNSFRDFTRSLSGDIPPKLSAFGGVDYFIGDVEETPEISFFRPLPETLREVTEVGRLCRESNWDVQLYTDADASEEQLKALYQSPAEGVLYIASHAFFFPDQAEDFEDDGESTIQTRILRSKNPLLKSGIALAGANNSWAKLEAIDTKEDGVLTALELSTLNLSQTDLVVLSACNTGLGEIRNIEGVFGLQRALKQAGARQILMSLWKVRDDHAKNFMIHFFNGLSAGQNAEDALRRARQKMREQGVAAKYWASFVLLN